MKEYDWINVYMLPSGRIWYGSGCSSKVLAEITARTAIKNGCKLLYRIHVRLK